MDKAAKILITGGTSAILISLLVGLELSRRRRTQPAATVHQWVVAHTTILFQGFLMLGLSFAALFARLGNKLGTTAASLVLVGAAFSVVASITNAVQGVQDQFAQRSLGLKLNTIQAVVMLPGVAILFIGVLRAL